MGRWKAARSNSAASTPRQPGHQLIQASEIRKRNCYGLAHAHRARPHSPPSWRMHRLPPAGRAARPFMVETADRRRTPSQTTHDTTQASAGMMDITAFLLCGLRTRYHRTTTLRPGLLTDIHISPRCRYTPKADVCLDASSLMQTRPEKKRPMQ
jgi:hypothetical protein